MSPVVEITVLVVPSPALQLVPYWELLSKMLYTTIITLDDITIIIMGIITTTIIVDKSIYLYFITFSITFVKILYIDDIRNVETNGTIVTIVFEFNISKQRFV